MPTVTVPATATEPVASAVASPVTGSGWSGPVHHSDLTLDALGSGRYGVSGTPGSGTSTARTPGVGGPLPTSATSGGREKFVRYSVRFA